jgi:hypothetical protein
MFATDKASSIESQPVTEAIIDDVNVKSFVTFFFGFQIKKE